LLSPSVVLDYCFTIGIDCKLSAEAQIDIQPKKRKAQAKKITGFQVHKHKATSISATWLVYV
jgi:hypothetical protein